MGIKKIYKRAVFHTDDELIMRHKYWFGHVPECDGISATANISGFTVLNAIKMRFGWDSNMIQRASNMCNERDEVAVLDRLTPRLFLVPRTRVDNPEKCQFYIKDLIAAVDAVGIKNLQFTHFSFTDHLAFKGELKVILKTIFSWKLHTQLQELILDTDYRVVERMFNSLNEVGIR